MPIVSIRHRTSYRYRNPVAFGEHRMMLRPQEGFDQRLLVYELEVSPQPSLLRHLHDLTDAGVAVARFDTRADALVVESRATLEHLPHAALDLEAADAAIDAGVFSYDAEEQPTLATSIQARHPDGGEVEGWARGFLRPVGRTHLSTVLCDMTHELRAGFGYEVREAGAPQTPQVTLVRRRGKPKSIQLTRNFAAGVITHQQNRGQAARISHRERRRLICAKQPRGRDGGIG